MKENEDFTTSLNLIEEYEQMPNEFKEVVSNKHHKLKWLMDFFMRKIYLRTNWNYESLFKSQFDKLLKNIWKKPMYNCDICFVGYDDIYDLR